MACPTIITGDQFVTRVITHIDCQAQVIGSYGYLALGQPGSTASVIVASLLTLFIALFGIRLLFGPPPGARDVVYDVLKIGIVLTLAFSWPAFRTVVYDVTLKGPAEIASVISASSGNASASDLPVRLQQVDNSIVALIEAGTGRNTGQFLNQNSPGATFAGTALQDDAAFGYSRLLFLAGIMAPLALLRIGAAVLLALTPVVAALWFFTQTRGIVGGWAKGLAFSIGGSITFSLGLSVQLAMVEPWLRDALNVRTLGYATPAAPTELFAIMLAFAVIQLALLWLIAKVVFYRGWLTFPDFPKVREGLAQTSSTFAAAPQPPPPQILRAERISNTIESMIDRERSTSSELLARTTIVEGRSGGAPTADRFTAPRLGSSYRRPSTRPSRAAERRDRTQ